MGSWAKPEFEFLKDNKWVWTEKVDGTNIRVIYKDGVVTFKGKTERAQIPADLVNKLIELFPAKKFEKTFDADAPICLYGEGFGNKIQKVGKLYNPDGVNFILFDVRIGDENNSIWLERNNVEEIAASMGIWKVPIVGYGSLGSAIQHTKNGFDSLLANVQAEGLVLRPETELLNRMGRRIITKIKRKDFAI
jgi:ATP-dependent RNA circularization protein (DNA/RNA ligase family)